MELVIERDNADAFSLLAALVAETFITDQDELHRLHQDAFYEASNRLLNDPLMVDIRSDFERLVVIPILCGEWALPASFHVSSISAPFITQAEFDEIHREMYLGIRPV